MTIRFDPEGAESQAIHSLVDFNGKNILEIGCGDGRLTARYAETAASVLAVDPKAGKIIVANGRSLKCQANPVIFQVDDITTLNLIPDIYDLAIFSWSM